MWISLSLDHFFDFSSVPLNSTIRNIHVKCSKLFEALSLVVAPLHILYKVTTELHKQTFPNQFSEKEKRIGWLRLVRPGLIDTDDPEKLKPDAHLALQAKLLGDYFLKVRFSSFCNAK